MKKTLLGTCLVMGLHGGANAMLLDGKTLLFATAYPSNVSGGNTSVTVGPGVEYPTWYGLAVDASDTQLVFSFSQAVNWNMPNGSTPFNGVRITDGDNGVASFAAVVIAPDTTLAGFDASHVTHSNDQILVNFAGLTSKVGDRIVLNVSAVPEPAQWTLMLAGGATMAGLSRRQRRPRHGT